MQKTALILFFLFCVILAKATKPGTLFGINAGNDTTICKGDSVTLGGSPTASGGLAPYTYEWSSIPAGFVSEKENPTVTPDTTAIFVLKVTDADGFACTDTVEIKVQVLDLDIDSDNDNELNPPDRKAAEDEIENDGTKPGKYISLNDGDIDNDMVPNYSDGFDKFGNAGTDAGGGFVPIILELPETVDLNTANITFTYSSSDPDGVEREGTGTYDDPYLYKPAPGNLRIWKKNGFADRKKSQVSAGGDFIKDGVAYSGAQLGEGRVITLYVEGISVSALTGDLQISVDVDNCGKDTVRTTGIKVDLDIDSDNDNALNLPPDRSLKEDHIEGLSGLDTRPGKVVAINNGDFDNDGVPNFADGFNMHDNEGLKGGGFFTPLIVELPPPIDINKTKLKFTYSASDPALVTKSGTTYTPAPGHLRIWKSNGTEMRNKADVNANGDYVKPREEYDASKFLTAAGRTIVLYVEGIEQSAAIADNTIKIEIDPNGASVPPGFISEDKVRITIIKAVIEKCPHTFEPKGGADDNTVTFKAKVLPNTIKGKFRFELINVSHEKGYCVNAPQVLPATGEDSDLWRDLQFPAQANFHISGLNNDTAVSTAANLNEVTIMVKSFDYGSYGRIRAIFIKNQSYAAIEDGGLKDYTNIPLDDDSNFIADSSVQNSGPGILKAALDDKDNTPAGAGKDGDGFSRYEEYRGIVAKGTFKRLNVVKKDVIVRNIDVADAGISGFLLTDSLTTPVYAIDSVEWNPVTRVVNFNNETAHGDNQQAIKVTEGGTTPSGSPWGVSTAKGGEPWAPNKQVSCIIYSGNSKRGTRINKAGGIGAADVTIQVLGTASYRDTGYIKIEDEIISYASKTATTFKNCVRGAMGTTAAAHGNMVKVNYFVSPTDHIKKVFGHECGHIIGLEHPGSVAARNIMLQSLYVGTILGDGFWGTFIGASSSLTGEFNVKE